MARVPAFRLGRAIGRPLTLPAAVTVNVLYACNSRCRTCNIYEHHADVLTTDEYDRIFRVPTRFGRPLYSLPKSSAVSHW